MEKLVGRETECERLNKCMQVYTAQLVVVYGRRVGITFFVNHFFQDKLEFKIIGAYNQLKEIQLRNFTN